MEGSIDGLGLDFGRFRGGFESAYFARIVPPQDSPVARSIARTIGTDLYPKVDVDIEYPSGKLRRLSFEGRPKLSCVLTTPNPLVAMVITDLQGEGGVHLIDADTGHTSAVFVSTLVECSASDITGKRLFLATCINVVAIGSEGVLWETRRVSLDGIKMLAYSSGRVRGIGIEPGNQDVSFSIDAATGEAAGGFQFAS